MIFGSKLRNGLVCVIRVGKAEPHWNRRQHSSLIYLLVVLLQGKCITLHSGRPESLIECRLAASELLRKLLAEVIFTCESSQIGKCPQGLDGQARLVILILDRKQRP